MTSMKCLSVFGLSLVSLLIFSAANDASAQAEPSRVAYRDISSINPVGDNTAIITDRRRNRYEVTFLSICTAKQHAEPFLFDSFQLGSYVDRGDVFSTGGAAAPCHVESVVLLSE